MPNDDLGQFPSPETISANTGSSDSSTPTNTATTFEETPDILPASNPTPEPAATPPTPKITTPTSPSTPVIASIPTPATLPTKSGSFGPVVFSVLFIVAILSVAGAAFLFQQTTALRSQLQQISQTVESRQTAPTPTPSVSEEVISNQNSSPSASPTPSPKTTITPKPTTSLTPTTVVLTPTPLAERGTPLKPLSISSKILKIAFDHFSTAEFILLKIEKAQDTLNSVAKYYFREGPIGKDTYFYVLVKPTSEPELVTGKIVVTPGSTIPSLNDYVLQNQLGADLDEALQTAYSLCKDKTACADANIKAQFINKDTIGNLWQLNFTLPGTTQEHIIQIAAKNLEIIFKDSSIFN